MREPSCRREVANGCVAVLVATMCGVCCAAASGAGGSESGSGAAASQAAPSVAGTPFSIESEMLIYRSLDAVAGAISERVISAIAPGVAGGRADLPHHVLLIATDEDTSTFLEWRALMGKAQLLHESAKEVLARSENLPPIPKRTGTIGRTPVAPVPGGPTVGGGAPHAPAARPPGKDVGQPPPRVAAPTVAQPPGFGDVIPAVTAVSPTAGAVVGAAAGVAGMLAETESMAAVPGTIQDLALVNATASRLTAAGPVVYVPSSYAPGLFGHPGLEGTLILESLRCLAQDRLTLQDAIETLADGLRAARAVVAESKPAKPAGGAQHPQRAKQAGPAAGAAAEKAAPEAETPEAAGACDYATKAKPVLVDASAVAIAIDGMLARVLGVSTTARIPDLDAAANEGAAEPEPAAAVDKAKNPAAKAKADGAEGAAQEVVAAFALARLLRADLVAQRIGLTAACAPPPPVAKPGESLPAVDRPRPDATTWHVLALKALESGGTTRVKSSIFRTAYSHSGGSVATFALYALTDGRLEAAGNAFAYEGLVGDGDVRARIDMWTKEGSPKVGPPRVP